MNTTDAIIVVKRDGSVEPFSRGKLRRVIAAAMRECRIDGRLADPLVQAVEVHLKFWEEPRPPTSEYVFRCVYAVLKQTDLEEVADALLSHRRQRRVRRRSLRVQRPLPKQGSKPWRKTTLVDTLEDRYGLQHATARIVAGELETRVLNLGYRLISANLLDELVDNELRAWGLTENVLGATCPQQQEQEQQRP